MTVHTSRLFLAALLIASPALAQPPSRPRRCRQARATIPFRRRLRPPKASAR